MSTEQPHGGTATKSEAPRAGRDRASWWRLIQQTVVSWWNDGCPRMGAALAYYTAFSVAPLLVLAIFIVGFIYGPDAAEGRIAQELEEMVGPEAASGVQAMITATQRAGEGPWATLLSLGIALFGASIAFNELRLALNSIWKVRPKPSAGWWYTLQSRLLTFLLVLFVGALLLTLMLLTSATRAATTWAENYIPFSGILAGWLNYFLTAAAETVLFAMLFKFLPDGTIAWRDVWLGAFVTAILFGIGNSLIGTYFAYSTVASAYGAAGSLAVFLLWAYYSAQVVYLGAEFTQVYAWMYGSQIEPVAQAEIVHETTPFSS